MTSLPMPIVVALMLVVLSVSHHRQLMETSSGKLFASVIYLHALSLFFVGLRWSLDDVGLLRFAAFFAVCGASVLYLAFRSLGQRPLFSLDKDWVHLVPAIGILSISLFGPSVTDLALALIKGCYAYLLYCLLRRSPESLQLTKLDWLPDSEKALWAVMLMMILSLVVDIAITIDFALYDGRHAASMVGTANLVSIFLLAWGAIIAGRASASSSMSELQPLTGEDKIAASELVGEDDKALLDKVTSMLVDERMYADSELSLQKLARKAGVPSRTISRAVNALTNQNVSQWINRVRIEAACEVLKDERVSVTEAMNASGFTTKSNFNREFKRLTGQTPSQWRKDIRE